jgi:hypothetical protein
MLNGSIESQPRQKCANNARQTDAVGDQSCNHQYAKHNQEMGIFIFGGFPQEPRSYPAHDKDNEWNADRNVSKPVAQRWCGKSSLERCRKT